LWGMNWTARLKHFHLPKKGDSQKEDNRRRKGASSHSRRVAEYGGLPTSSSADGGCHLAGNSDCGSKDGALSLFDSIVRH
jgi:hypothetical protein